jgi:hypothetical protein
VRVGATGLLEEVAGTVAVGVWSSEVLLVVAALGACLAAGRTAVLRLDINVPCRAGRDEAEE